MVRLSSRDASLLMDVLEQRELPPEERQRLLDQAEPVVREIGEALIHPELPVENADVKEAAESIRQWAEETRKSEETQRQYA